MGNIFNRYICVPSVEPNEGKLAEENAELKAHLANMHEQTMKNQQVTPVARNLKHPSIIHDDFFGMGERLRVLPE